MKRPIISMILLILASTTFAQQVEPSPSLTREDYLRKSKHQKTAAWVLTGIGTAGLIVTLAADATQTVGGAYTTLLSAGTVEPEYRSFTGYYIVSAVCLGAGITYFIVARKNKQRANALATYLKMENAMVLHYGGLKKLSYPSIAVKISF